MMMKTMMMIMVMMIMVMITLTKFIGSRAFGEVFEGLVSQSELAGGGEGGGSSKIAAKTLRKGATESEKLEFLKEVKLMSNDHILNLIAICLDNDHQVP